MKAFSVRRSEFALLLMVLMLAACSIGQSVNAQFNEERRRGDLSPLRLPGGSVVKFGSFESTGSGMPAPYSVFLPPSFSREPTRTYPVVYFLHGLNNDQTSWTVERYGHLQNKVEEMILSKRIPEIIMVHPWGGNSFYCNYADGSRNFENLITEELVAYTEAHYRAKKGRENRSIGGTSMGGYGALKIAMKRPELYAATAGHSPIIFLGKNPLDVPENVRSSRYYGFFAEMLKTIFGDPFRQELWDENNPLILAKKGNIKQLKIYFDYGTEDRYNETIQLDRGVQALHQALTEARVPHVYKVHSGEPHGWLLVAAHLEESLPFLCQTFK